VQSIDAMADAVKFHQPNTPYSEADYFSSESKSNQQQNSDVLVDNEQVIDDHCCYCHGVSHGVFTDNSRSFNAIRAIENIKSNPLAYLSQLITTDLRTPIV